MNSMSIAQKIVQFRKAKGYSQEALSEKANISLRTLQRIEKGDTEPRGHTLRAITEVLEVPVEELMDFTKKEDTGFLQVMSLSALAYWFMPVLNILLPLVLWLFNKEKVKDADKAGRQIISFQILWTILAYGIPFGFFLFWPSFLSEVSPGNFFPVMYGVPAFFYLVIVIFIFISVVRIKKGKKWVYFIPLKFI